ncbi:hypothetical protein NK983_34220, partial [Salmonella enterica subsp. enterica serovar Typhimurium]|nr:hypothetical protein [Salmonella enterica subsp. enterica serovar Typhimurium]
MKRSLLFGIVLLSLSGSLLLWYDSSADPCGGRCTGSAYCTACTNCSRCHHCKYGGSCGVCAAPEPKALR